MPDGNAAVPCADHRLRFAAFGVTAELVSSDPGLLAAMGEALPPAWHATEDAPAASFRITTDGRVIRDERRLVRRAADRGQLLIELTSTLRQHIAERAPEHVFIHAGVVAVGPTAVVIPGRSASGKTTLVGELVGRGATYYSDEYAVVDAHGLIHPFPQPLARRVAGHPHRRERVGVTGERTAEAPIRAGLILVTSFAPGEAWAPRPGTAGEGAVALLENTVPARLRPRQAMAAIGRLARDARVLTGPRGEASQVAGVLLDAILAAEA